MKWKSLAVLLVAFAVPSLCPAQDLKAGTWTGSVQPPDGGLTVVTYDVTVKGDSLGVVIHAGEHGDFTARDGHYTEGKIKFAFDPGISVRCTLARGEDGSFTGECLGEDGSVAQIIMVPPKE